LSNGLLVQVPNEKAIHPGEASTQDASYLHPQAKLCLQWRGNGQSPAAGVSAAQVYGLTADRQLATSKSNFAAQKMESSRAALFLPG
jgi:hypothetical protein